VRKNVHDQKKPDEAVEGQAFLHEREVCLAQLAQRGDIIVGQRVVSYGW
jgi:hypothetical protein